MPVDSLSLPEFVFTGADVLPSAPEIDYPALKTNDTNAGTRTYSPNPLVTTEIYNLVSPDLNGNIAFITNDKTKFFIGLFLHYCNGGDQNVDELLEKVFFEEFGLVP